MARTTLTAKTTIASALASLLLCGNAMAYSASAHGQMSAVATARSVLGSDPDLLTSLGVPADVAPTLGHVANLIAQGTLDEDDLFPLVRVMHHFYDPVHERALHPCIAFCLPPFCGFTPPVCHQSPTWALEDTEEIGSQDFSFRDARARLREAFTEPSQQSRNEAWRQSFLDLGHLVHHLEDMAQPQHVRNDAHPGSPWEAYAEERAAAYVPTCGYPNVTPMGLTPPATGGRALWKSNPAGAGLAEFSNRNFVTDDTNFRGSLMHLASDPDYPFPDAAEVHVDDVTIAALRSAGENIPASAPDGIVHLLRTPVRDFYASDCAPAETWTSTYSIYTLDLAKANKPLDFRVNHINMDHGYAILLPRAIGYAAGIIDHFFRARIDFVPSPNDVGRYLLRNRGTERLSGTFTVYYDDENGMRHDVPSATWQRTLEVGGETPVDFAATSVPADDFVVIFDGTVGTGAAAETGVTTAKVVHGGHGFATPGGRLNFDGTEWKTRQETLRYGNTNWYGQAGILSWTGPWGRYLQPRPLSELSPVIFQDGSPRFTAPGPVLGAALRVDATVTPPRTYVTAIVVATDGGANAIGELAYSAPVDVLQQDPAAWGAPIASYAYADPGQPNGLPAITSMPAHYFFNASGTEAQSVKGDDGGQVQPFLTFLPFRRIVFSIAGSFSLQPMESNSPQVSHSTHTDFDGCCAPSDQFHPTNIICTFLGGSSHDDFTEVLRWTIAADYRGDQPVFAVRETHREGVGDFTSDAGTESGSSSSASSDRLIVGGLTLDTLTASSNSTQGTGPGIHDCNPDRCFFFFDGACHWLQGLFHQVSDSASDEKRLEFLDLRSADPLIVFAKVHSVFHFSFDQGGSGVEQTSINEETPMWMVGGTQAQLGPTRIVDSPIGRHVTASTNPLGQAILDWPDFALSRLFPAGDPRALTGYSTPAGLF